MPCCVRPTREEVRARRSRRREEESGARRAQTRADPPKNPMPPPPTADAGAAFALCHTLLAQDVPAPPFFARAIDQSRDPPSSRRLAWHCPIANNRRERVARPGSLQPLSCSLSRTPLAFASTSHCLPRQSWRPGPRATRRKRVAAAATMASSAACARRRCCRVQRPLVPTASPVRVESFGVLLLLLRCRLFSPASTQNAPPHPTKHKYNNTHAQALVHPLELEAWISGRGSVGGSGTDDAAAAPPPALLLTDPSAASATPICL